MKRTLAPENCTAAALRVLFIAGVSTRNWTLTQEVSRGQINDLWEAIHEIPAVLANWDDQASENELIAYLREYDKKWDDLMLEKTYLHEKEK